MPPAPSPAERAITSEVNHRETVCLSGEAGADSPDAVPLADVEAVPTGCVLPALPKRLRASRSSSVSSRSVHVADPKVLSRERLTVTKATKQDFISSAATKGGEGK